MKHSRTLLALALVTVAGASFAQKPAPWPDRYEVRHEVRHEQGLEARQERRIEQGIQSGALTRREGRQLLRQEARIDAVERRYLADGRFTPDERHHVAELRRDAERDLRRALRDRDVAWR